MEGHDPATDIGRQTLPCLLPAEAADIALKLGEDLRDRLNPDHLEPDAFVQVAFGSRVGSDVRDLAAIGEEGVGPKRERAYCPPCAAECSIAPHSAPD
jgi:hypothetical protein